MQNILHALSCSVFRISATENASSCVHSGSHNLLATIEMFPLSESANALVLKTL